MSRLYSARIILQILQKAGFVIVGQKGSHIKLFKRDRGDTYTVIVPNHKEVAMGTFLSILRQAGISKKEFEKLF